jgi:signal transduction histidine kinase
VLLEVIDRGPGIPLERREAVFDRFMQLNPGGKGLGLGLYICRELVVAMAGEIWIGDSDTGTRVCLSLPLAEETES